MSIVEAGRLGDVVMAVNPQEADGQGAQGGHDLRTMAVRIWDRSSSKVPSRTQWILFSIPQCPCMKYKRSDGEISSDNPLVMP